MNRMTTLKKTNYANTCYKNMFLETEFEGGKERCQHKETQKQVILQGVWNDVPKNDTDGGGAPLGREVSHEKEGEYGQGQVGKLLVL